MDKRYIIFTQDRSVVDTGLGGQDRLCFRVHPQVEGEGEDKKTIGFRLVATSTRMASAYSESSVHLPYVTLAWAKEEHLLHRVQEVLFRRIKDAGRCNCGCGGVVSLDIPRILADTAQQELPLGG